MFNVHGRSNYISLAKTLQLAFTLWQQISTIKYPLCITSLLVKNVWYKKKVSTSYDFWTLQYSSKCFLSTCLAPIKSLPIVCFEALNKHIKSKYRGPRWNKNVHLSITIFKTFILVVFLVWLTDTVFFHHDTYKTSKHFEFKKGLYTIVASVTNISSDLVLFTSIIQLIADLKIVKTDNMREL